MNLQKSFSEGPFRESCGSHFWNGSDVKPIFFKEIARHPFGVYREANSIRRLANRRLFGLGCDARLRPAWKLLVDSLPKELQFRIDDTLGDGGFISNFDEVTPPRARDHKDFPGWEGYLVYHATSVGITQHTEQTGLLLAQLDRLSELRDFYTDLYRDRTDPLPLKPSSIPLRGNQYTLRGRVRPTVGRGLVKQWTDLGPWI